MSVKMSEQNIRREDWQSLEPSVEGWGINDANYPAKPVNKLTGGRDECPYYKRWDDILRRGKSDKWKADNPSYIGCDISDDFKYFTDFIAWVDRQGISNWEEYHLDKDLLVQGNRIYSADTCVFLKPEVNSFIKNKGEKSHKHLLGVNSANSRRNPYMARCSNPFTGEREYLGLFPTEMQAHLAWKAKKHEHALRYVELETDQRIKDALVKLYSPESDWTMV